jgi:hypothetical protein
MIRGGSEIKMTVNASPARLSRTTAAAIFFARSKLLSVALRYAME